MEEPDTTEMDTGMHSAEEEVYEESHSDYTEEENSIPIVKTEVLESTKLGSETAGQPTGTINLTQTSRELEQEVARAVSASLEARDDLDHPYVSFSVSGSLSSSSVISLGPTLTVMSHINSPLALTSLNILAKIFRGNRKITTLQSQWVFALLLRVDNLLEGEEIARLRYLVASIPKYSCSSDIALLRQVLLGVVGVLYGQRDLLKKK